MQHGAVGVDDPGAADRDAEQAAGGHRREAFHQPDDPNDGLFPGGTVDLDLGAVHHVAAEVRDRADEVVGEGQVDDDDVERVDVEGDEGRGLADPQVLPRAEAR